MSDVHTDPHESRISDSNATYSRQAGLWESWSQRLIWISACLLAGVVLWNGWLAYEQNMKARAVRCDTPVFNFGQGFVDDVIEHTFRVTNVSRGPLVIDRVITSCGCTTVGAELSEQSIGPGQSFEVPVKLTLSKSEKGDLERPVIVRIRDEPGMQLTLKLKGQVENRWAWSTGRVSFDKIQANETATRTLNLTLHPKAKLAEAPKVLATAKSSLRVDVEPDPASDGNRSFRVTISTVPPMSPGRHEATLMASAEGSTIASPVQVVLVVSE